MEIMGRLQSYCICISVRYFIKGCHVILQRKTEKCRLSEAWHQVDLWLTEIYEPGMLIKEALKTLRLTPTGMRLPSWFSG